MLTAVVLTLNEEYNLPDCLTSLAWVDEVVVFDSCSSDRTCDIAREHGARVMQLPFENYAAQRNAALAAVKSDWVFFVDADERASPELSIEVRDVIRESEPVGWWVPRHNYIFGRLTMNAGWYPDYQMRLLRLGHAEYDQDRHVHELVKLQGSSGHLQQPLVHFNYATVGDFIERQHYYARYDARILYRQEQTAHWHNFVLQPLRQFLWRLVTLDGWRCGWHGLRISALMGYAQFVLYRHLREFQRGHDRKCSS